MVLTDKENKQGVYKKGRERINDILDAATNLLIDSGYHNFSLRRVAAAANIRLGNLQYYFPSKDQLVRAMLDRVIQVYLDSFDEIRHHGTPREQFVALIEHVLSHLNEKKTTIFFPELWSLSNHEEYVGQFMDDMYGKYRLTLGAIIAEINPALSASQVTRLSLFISASIEGHTVFIGYEKPWTKETNAIISMATQSFLWLIEHGEIPDNIGKRAD